MRLSHLGFVVLITLGFILETVRSDCKFGTQTICDGAVTAELSELYVRVCDGTAVKTKRKESGAFVFICDRKIVRRRLKSLVKPGYPLVGRDTGPGKDCIWYGTTYCEGDVIVDLYRWWFESKCSEGKMRVRSRPLNAVLNDPRYKALQQEKLLAEQQQAQP